MKFAYNIPHRHNSTTIFDAMNIFQGYKNKESHRRYVVTTTQPFEFPLHLKRLHVWQYKPHKQA